MSWRDAIAKAILRGKQGGPTAEGIMTYHSSPHDFTRFDPMKAGTGEGGAAFGKGAAYLSESPAVSGQGGAYWNVFKDRFPATEVGAADVLAKHGFDREAAIAAAQKQIEQLKSHPASTNLGLLNKIIEKRQAEFNLLRGDNPVGPRTYEVNFRAKPEELMDWDAPVAKQAGRLQPIAQRFGIDLNDAYGRGNSGGDFYTDITRRIEDTHRLVGGEAKGAASQAFVEAGIPGWQYLDARSRPALSAPQLEQKIADRQDALKFAQKTGDPARIAYHEGLIDDWRRQLYVLQNSPPTYNYVAADPSRLDIMAKYGIVGGAPAGMGAIAAQDRYGEQ